MVYIKNNHFDILGIIRMQSLAMLLQCRTQQPVAAMLLFLVHQTTNRDQVSLYCSPAKVVRKRTSFSKQDTIYNVVSYARKLNNSLVLVVDRQLPVLLSRVYIFCRGTHVITAAYLPLCFRVFHLFVGEPSWQETLAPPSGAAVCARMALWAYLLCIWDIYGGPSACLSYLSLHISTNGPWPQACSLQAMYMHTKRDHGPRLRKATATSTSDIYWYLWLGIKSMMTLYNPGWVTTGISKDLKLKTNHLKVGKCIYKWTSFRRCFNGFSLVVKWR